MNNASLELGGTNWAEKDASLLGYTVSDDSGRFSPQEFTFARGSNLAATRIGKTGLIVKGRENLLLQSNQFDTTWTPASQGAIAGNQAGYDGSNDAWLLTAGAQYSRVQQTISQSGVNTFSVYAKSGTEGGIFLRLNGGSNPRCFFDLNNGQVGDAAGDNIDASIESVGNGWYRCSLITNNNADAAQIYIANDNNGFVTSGNIFIQDAQLEQGLVATPYIPTTTTSAQAGVLENTPRLNYTPGVANPYLLLEPSRTNVISQSEYFDSSEWAFFTGATLGSSFVVSPEGYNNATTLNFGSGSESLIFFDYSSGSATFTISVYARSSTGKKFCFRNWNGSSAERSSDFTTTTEWKRFEFTFTSAVVNFGICNESSGVSGSIEIYGAQVEQGLAATYATSYIPTYSVSATRAIDVCSKTNASGEIGQTEGTLYAEVAKNNVLGGEGGFYLRKDSSNEIRLNLATNNRLNLFVNVGGVNQAYMDNSTFTLENYNKIAVKYKLNDYSVFVNGTKIYTDTSALVPADMNELKFNSLYGKVNAIQVYKEALTDAELATLTTI